MHKFRVGAKVWTLLAGLLAGGTLFGTCELRLKDAFIDGSKSVLLGFLDPSSVEGYFGSSDDGDQGDGD